MCGRYRLSRRKQIVEEHFDAMSDDDWTPRYNIAPTQPVPVIRWDNPQRADSPKDEAHPEHEPEIGHSSFQKSAWQFAVSQYPAHCCYAATGYEDYHWI
jgi:putative SOS response-associated peptidase YedK